jgi:hypothetical protein
MFPNRGRFSRFWSTRRFAAPLLVACLFVAGSTVAAQRVTMPSFNLQLPGGSLARTSDWPLQGKWVLIYVEGRCQACVTLLGRLTQKDYPQLAARTIIVGGGMQPAEVKALQTRFPDLAGAQWYADPSKNAAPALNFHGAPVILGIKDRVSQWGQSGLSPDPKRLQPMLMTWVTQ